jgi:hypothetical protein
MAGELFPRLMASFHLLFGIIRSSATHFTGQIPTAKRKDSMAESIMFAGFLYPLQIGRSGTTCVWPRSREQMATLSQISANVLGFARSSILLGQLASWRWPKPRSAFTKNHRSQDGSSCEGSSRESDRPGRAEKSFSWFQTLLPTLLMPCQMRARFGSNCENVEIRSILLSRCTQIEDLFPFLFNIVRVFTAKSLH